MEVSTERKQNLAFCATTALRLRPERVMIPAIGFGCRSIGAISISAPSQAIRVNGSPQLTPTLPSARLTVENRAISANCRQEGRSNDVSDFARTGCQTPLCSGLLPITHSHDPVHGTAGHMKPGAKAAGNGVSSHSEATLW